MPPPLHVSPLELALPPLVLSFPANPTLSSLRFITENILPLWTIGRVETRVRFGERADLDAGAALVAAGLPVGDVADAHRCLLFFRSLYLLAFDGVELGCVVELRSGR